MVKSYLGHICSLILIFEQWILNCIEYSLKKSLYKYYLVLYMNLPILVLYLRSQMENSVPYRCINGRVDAVFVMWHWQKEIFRTNFKSVVIKVEKQQHLRHAIYSTQKGKGIRMSDKSVFLSSHFEHSNAICHVGYCS